MWITRQFVQNERQSVATTAQVTLAKPESVCTTGSSAQSVATVYVPFGIESLPPVGAQVLLIESEDGTACIGTACDTRRIEQGELRLFSKGGASIVLKNNGDIKLNGVTITKQGQIIETGV